MSARDDASPSTDAPRPPGTGWRARRAVPGGALVGLLLAWLLLPHLPPGPWPRYEVRVGWEGGPPTAAEWPRAPRPGESARVVAAGRDARLVVHAPRAEDARALAAALQRERVSGMGAGLERRSAERARWTAGALSGSPPWLSRAAGAAAWVRGRLLLVPLSDLRVEPAPPPRSPAVDRSRARLEVAQARVLRLALAARPDSLEWALVSCAAAEGDWLRRVAAHPAVTSRAQVEAAWRWHDRAFARALDDAERRLEARLTEAQADLVPPAALARALRLERLAPDPAAAFFVGGRWADDVEPEPVARTWALLLGAGALAGALGGLAGTAPRRRPRGAMPRRRPAAGSGVALAWAPATARRPEQALRAELSWLHVVSGPDGVRVAHAVDRLASVFVDRGERVLAVDAGQGLALHERFGADARWGLGDCLAGEVPLLGAVQSTGRPRFLLLGRGAAGANGRWEAMSALLEEARRHFDRVVLALEPGAPRAAALPLGGRVLEAWWAEPGEELPRRAAALADRLGISFVNLDLGWLTYVEHEGAMAAPASPEAAPVAAPAAIEPPAELGALVETEAPVAVEPPVALERPVAPEPPAAAAPAGPPPVLDCDPEVRDRLRFLVWMKRVQAERRAAPVGAGAEG